MTCGGAENQRVQYAAAEQINEISRTNRVLIFMICNPLLDQNLKMIDILTSAEKVIVLFQNPSSVEYPPKKGTETDL